MKILRKVNISRIFSQTFNAIAVKLWKIEPLETPPVRFDRPGCLQIYEGFSGNSVFEIGGHDFANTNAPILLQIYILLLNTID